MDAAELKFQVEDSRRRAEIAKTLGRTTDGPAHAVSDVPQEEYDHCFFLSLLFTFSFNILQNPQYRKSLRRNDLKTKRRKGNSSARRIH